MIDQKKSRLTLTATAVLTAGIVLAGAAVLYCFDPTKYGFYPKCPVYRLVGIKCPGCGNTRAVYMLLHGNIRQSLQYNLMLLPSLCYLGFIIFCKSKKEYWITAVWLIGLAAYTIFRNINPRVLF